MFDLSALWEQGKDKIQNQIDSFVSTGVPAIQSAVEKEAIAWLTKSNEATQSRLQEGIRAQLDAPPSAFGEALSQAGAGAFMDKYGMYLAGGALVIGFLILRK